MRDNERRVGSVHVAVGIRCGPVRLCRGRLHCPSPPPFGGAQGERTPLSPPLLLVQATGLLGAVAARSSFYETFSTAFAGEHYGERARGLAGASALLNGRAKVRAGHSFWEQV